MTISIEAPTARPRAARTPEMLVVKEACWLCPYMRCIRLEGPGVEPLCSDRPAAWLKLFLDQDGQRSDTGRAYTIRRCDRAAGTIDVEFVIHGEGPLSQWAAQATPGAVIHGAGPRGGYELPGRARRIVMLGDPSATPAMLRIIETLPGDIAVKAFIELPPGQSLAGFAAGHAEIAWLARMPATRCGAGLVAALANIEIAEDCAVWVAAESGAVDCIRRHLLNERGVNRQHLSASGYWKCGDIDYRDPEADWGWTPAATACG